jgi:hypothetical protein
MWTPAVQISNTAHGCTPNVHPSWSQAGSRRIHHVFRECLTDAVCGGSGAIGWYLEVGPGLDSAAWVSAWDSRHLLTGEQSNGDSLEGQDFDMVVDRNDVVHVVHEVFNHQAYPMEPAVAYKTKGMRSWDPDTAVVLSDTLTAGITHCPRRDHGPQLFLERTGDEDTIHVAIAHDTDSLSCTTPEHWMVYTKKAVDTPDTGSYWPKETFATEGFARHPATGGTTMIRAGISTVLRDSNGRVHMWGKAKPGCTLPRPGHDSVAALLGDAAGDAGSRMAGHDQPGASEGLSAQGSGGLPPGRPT